MHKKMNGYEWLIEKNVKKKLLGFVDSIRKMGERLSMKHSMFRKIVTALTEIVTSGKAAW